MVCARSSFRLGGIYARARLAREHPGDYHTQIMGLVRAFVRKRPALPSGIKVREDLQAVMSVICVRSAVQIEIEKEERFTLNFSGTHLKSVDLAYATGAIHGKSVLRTSHRFRSNMTGAFLIGTDLSGAFLNSATSLTGWSFSVTCRTASRLNSSVYRCCPISTLLKVASF